jgi:soluble lytic murein transglycosylase-like protein
LARNRLLPTLVLAVLLLSPVISQAASLPPLKLPEEFPSAYEEEAILAADPAGAGPASAIVRLARGEAAVALPVLERWEERDLADCRIYFLARAKLATGDAAGAAALLERFPSRFPDSPWSDDSLFLLALCADRRGDRRGAVAHLAEIPRKTGSPILPWALAQSAVWRRDVGDPGWKGDLFRLGVEGLDHPASVALAATWREPLAPLLDDESLVAAIRVANDHRALGVLFPALDTAAARFGERISGELLEIDGTASYLVRKNERAAKVFETILTRFPTSASLVPKALYHQALLAYRADDTPTAHAKIKRVLEKYPSSSWAQRGAKSISRDYFRHGDRAEARKIVGETLARAEQPIFDVVWAELWLGYRDGDAPFFVSKGKEVIDRWKEHYRKGRIAYWQARLGETKGIEGTPAYSAVAKEYPLNLWGIFASWRAAGGKGDPIAPASAAISSMIPPLPADPSPTTVRARRFASLGLFSFAAREEKEGTAKGWLLTKAGDFAQAVSLALKGGVASAGWNWRFSYPRAYRAIVEKEAAAARVDPALVWSIMREESRYDPLIVSSSDARGLMQLYPPTTLPDFPQMAKSADDFFDIPTNIAIGVRILARGLKTFDGAPIPSIAAYNAGEGAVKRWVAQGKGLEIDEFTEEISYDQTRDYVARVMAAYAVYKALERVDP